MISEYYSTHYSDQVADGILANLHGALPKRPNGSLDELFRIPPEAELLLQDTELVIYLSDKDLSTKELLRRCNNFLDMYIPNMSGVFTSLHFTSSMWSRLSVVVRELTAGRKPDGVTEETDEREGLHGQLTGRMEM
jgi:hypothetical protein